MKSEIYKARQSSFLSKIFPAYWPVISFNL